MNTTLQPLPSEAGTSTPPVGDRSYYTVSEAATLLGVSRVTIWRLIRDGRLPVWRLGHRTTRITAGDLHALFVRGGPTGAPVGVGGAAALGAAADGFPAGGAARVDDPESSLPAHAVQFYDSDDFLHDTVADFIGTALQGDDAGIVVATAEHRVGIEARLQAAGCDLAAARACGRYVALDAAQTLARFLGPEDEGPDAARFIAGLGEVITGAARQGRCVRIFGEMVALLAVAGKHTAALRLEELWNALQRTHAFSLLCAYPMSCLAGDGLALLLNEVCEAHSQVIPAESYTALSTPGDRLREIVVLQEKAHLLEAAVAAERAAREETAAALHMRDEFLGAVAHDLRSPLTTVQGMAQLLLRQARRVAPPELPRLAAGLETIEITARKMTAMVQEILDLTQLEMGQQLTLTAAAVDLTALLQGAVRDAQQMTSQHRVVLQAPAQPLAGEWDGLRLERVFANLLSNAIKYSPDGGTISVTPAEIAADGEWCEVAVADEGMGIPAEDLPHIFERFYRAAGVTGRVMGTGLGLAGVKQIVEQHGGTISVESTVGAGSRFVVRLPRVCRAAERSAVEDGADADGAA